VCAFIPRAMEREVICPALEKVREEKCVRSALKRGTSAKAAFERYEFVMPLERNRLTPRPRYI